MNFSHPLFARLFVLLPMIFLTVNATILHEVAGTPFEFEFDVVHFRFAAVGTYFVGHLF
jgi:hypothetical protein